jgi:II/X family phage/plasmid replication protein
MYSKFDELHARKKGHSLSDILFTETQIKKLNDNASGLLRIEITLRRIELNERLNIKTLQDLQYKNKVLFMEYTKKIDVSTTTKLANNVMMAVPASSRPVYTMWFEGYDVKAILPKSSYYNHRRVLLGFGINISVKSEKGKKEEEENKLTLASILAKSPEEVPLWAYEEKLVAM